MLIRNRDRDLDRWLPAERIKSDWIEKIDITQKPYSCLTNYFGSDTTVLKQKIKNADIDFSKSQPRAEPPSYFVELKMSESETIFATLVKQKSTYELQLPEKYLNDCNQ